MRVSSLHFMRACVVPCSCVAEFIERTPADQLLNVLVQAAAGSIWACAVLEQYHSFIGAFRILNTEQRTKMLVLVREMLYTMKGNEALIVGGPVEVGLWAAVDGDTRLFLTAATWEKSW